MYTKRVEKRRRDEYAGALSCLHQQSDFAKKNANELARLVVAGIPIDTVLPEKLLATRDPDTKELDPDTKGLDPDTKGLDPDTKKKLLEMNNQPLGPDTYFIAVTIEQLCNNKRVYSDYLEVAGQVEGEHNPAVYKATIGKKLSHVLHGFGTTTMYVATVELPVKEDVTERCPLLMYDHSSSYFLASMFQNFLTYTTMVKQAAPTKTESLQPFTTELEMVDIVAYHMLELAAKDPCELLWANREHLNDIMNKLLRYYSVTFPRESLDVLVASGEWLELMTESSLCLGKDDVVACNTLSFRHCLKTD
jgi:hypothetical protein